MGFGELDMLGVQTLRYVVSIRQGTSVFGAWLEESKAAGSH